MGKFESKVVVVTGTGQGVEKRLVICFYKKDAVVGLLGLNGQNLDAVVKEVNPDISRFLIYAVDISDNRQVTPAIDDTDRRFGRIDILTNNAGVLHKGMTENSADMHMEPMVDVNLMGPTYCTRASVPYTKENGGSIINVSSILAAFPNTGSGAYEVAEASMIILTKVWAAGLAPYKTRINCYAPGVLNTPMAEDMIKSRVEGKLCQIPLRRFGETDDALDLISFLCSDWASYTTGQTIGLDEGVWATQTSTATWGL